MSRKHVNRVCITSDEDETVSEPADDPNDMDFVPSPFVRRPTPAVEAPRLPIRPVPGNWVKLPPHVDDGGTGL
jgi:hypothetical protein